MRGNKPPELDTNDKIEGDPFDSPTRSPPDKTAFDDERSFWRRHLMLQNGTTIVTATAKKTCDP